MNFNNIVVYDFETSSANAPTTQILQLAAVVLNGRTLEIMDEDAKFQAYCKPSRESEVEQGALDVNGLSLEFLKDKPSEEHVWREFVSFCKKYSKGKSQWNNPIAAGYNISGFDNIISRRACEQYKTSYPFHPRDVFDVMGMLSFWHENNPRYAKMSFDFARQWYGLSSEGAHNAIVDVEQTAMVLTRKLRWMRKVAENQNFFEGAFAKK